MSRVGSVTTSIPMLKHVALALHIFKHTGSKRFFQILNKFGHVTSYDDAQRYNNRGKTYQHEHLVSMKKMLPYTVSVQYTKYIICLRMHLRNMGYLEKTHQTYLQSSYRVNLHYII